MARLLISLMVLITLTCPLLGQDEPPKSILSVGGGVRDRTPIGWASACRETMTRLYSCVNYDYRPGEMTTRAELEYLIVHTKFFLLFAGGGGGGSTTVGGAESSYSGGGRIVIPLQKLVPGSWAVLGYSSLKTDSVRNIFRIGVGYSF